jgi:hypoxanthine-guanine phosphoribosyltransferase
MHGDIDRVLIPQEKIAARVRELAREITKDHTPPNISAKPKSPSCPFSRGP